MNDEQLAEYLDITPEMVAQITPDLRATYERMADIETGIDLWRAGVRPKPEGVILCGVKEVKMK